MGIFDVFRAAIQPAAAARAGYLGGQSAEEDKQRQEAIQQAGLERQARMDALTTSLDTSEINRNNGEAARANRPAVVTPTYTAKRGKDGTVVMVNDHNPNDVIQPRGPDGQPLLADKQTDTPPEHLTTPDGRVLERSPTTGTWSAARMGDGSPIVGSAADKPPTLMDKLAAARQGVALAEQGLPHPSKNQYIPNPAYTTAPAEKKAVLPAKILNPAYPAAVADSAAYDKGTLQPARQSLMDVIRSINTGAPTTGASGAPAPDPTGKPTADPSTVGTSFTDAPSAYAAAAAAYRKMLAMPGADPQAASARYNDMIAKIAKKFGQMPTP